MSSKQRKTLGTGELQRIVELCASIEAKGLNPFIIEVDDLITIIKEYFPEWEKPEELSLDSEALNKIASVIKLQSEWVKHRATTLYTDPFLVEEKIRVLSPEKIADIFLEAWRPAVEMEQLSIPGLSRSLSYWRGLSPLDERWQNVGFTERATGTATREELIQQRVLSGEGFSERLESFWRELKAQDGGEGMIGYWDFVGAETYSETVERAYLTSFLVTYGYATLKINPLEEEVFIKPFEEQVSQLKAQQLVSVPIPVSYEEWLEWRSHREA